MHEIQNVISLSLKEMNLEEGLVLNNKDYDDINHAIVQLLEIIYSKLKLSSLFNEPDIEMIQVLKHCGEILNISSLNLEYIYRSKIKDNNRRIS